MTSGNKAEWAENVILLLSLKLFGWNTLGRSQPSEDWELAGN